ncbi:Dynein heavy chain 1, axonemal [Manis javanica]|nr:major allergen I polypeptide chain 2-like [Manis javanica]KAI5928957.1 Dynein heavy chain 1, axonemal [Manis javanica]
MKRTLLVLALLVTGELSIWKAEACPIFYGIFGAMALGSPMLLDLSLFLAKATEPEKAALRKIQDCYNEAGFVSKVLDAIVLGTIATSKECIANTLEMMKKDVHEALSILNPVET